MSYSVLCDACFDGGEELAVNPGGARVCILCGNVTTIPHPVTNDRLVEIQEERAGMRKAARRKKVLEAAWEAVRDIERKVEMFGDSEGVAPEIADEIDAIIIALGELAE